MALHSGMDVGDMADTTPIAASKAYRARRILRHCLSVAGLVLIMLVTGFMIFAHGVSSTHDARLREADGIVALTGGEERIAEAVRLLAGGKAKRLLISGVNPSTSKPELISLNPRSASLFICCVDLDKRALDTQDNAQETTAWVKERGFRSLIVVTSSYHMPRSLIELRQAMRDVELIPYPVRPPTMRRERWWADRHTVVVLAKEYIKLVTAISRYAAHALFTQERGADTRVINARMS